MVWKTGPLKESSQKLKGRCLPDKNRYAHAVKDPAGYSLCPRDYDSHHKARGWPPGTEYQQAYCSSYTPAADRQRHQQQQQQRFQCLERQFRQHRLQQQNAREEDCIWHCEQKEHDPYYEVHQQHERQQRYHKQQHQCPCSDQSISEEEHLQRMADQCLQQQKQQDQQRQNAPDSCSYGRRTSATSGAAHFQPGQPPSFPLYERAPSALMDKHYRGAHYTPGDAVGVQVPEEFTRVRETPEGSTRISCQEDLNNVYLPLYRYKDWVERSELEVYRDCNTQNVICRLPDAPTQYWDFYNEVRMHRPKQDLGTAQYRTCRAVPIPRDKDMESVSSTPYDPYSGQYGKFNGYKFEEAAFQPQSLCRC